MSYDAPIIEYPELQQMSKELREEYVVTHFVIYFETGKQPTFNQVLDRIIANNPE